MRWILTVLIVAVLTTLMGVGDGRSQPGPQTCLIEVTDGPGLRRSGRTSFTWNRSRVFPVAPYLVAGDGENLWTLDGEGRRQKIGASSVHVVQHVGNGPILIATNFPSAANGPGVVGADGYLTPVAGNVLPCP
jgi:hypothetical protein